MITGTSSGIGAATALACARAGMDSVLTARRPDRLQEVAEQVKELGRSAEVVVGDVTDEGLSGRLLDAARERFGRFDAVFANAGYGHGGPMHELDEAALRRIFDVNFFAAMALLREAARRLVAEKRRGHLLMCSSTLSKFALPTGGAYAATKAAQSRCASRCWSFGRGASMLELSAANQRVEARKPSSFGIRAASMFRRFIRSRRGRSFSPSPPESAGEARRPSGHRAEGGASASRRRYQGGARAGSQGGGVLPPSAKAGGLDKHRGLGGCRPHLGLPGHPGFRRPLPPAVLMTVRQSRAPGFRRQSLGRRC